MLSLPYSLFLSISRLFSSNKTIFQILFPLIFWNLETRLLRVSNFFYKRWLILKWNVITNHNQNFDWFQWWNHIAINNFFPWFTFDEFDEWMWFPIWFAYTYRWQIIVQNQDGTILREWVIALHDLFRRRRREGILHTWFWE